MTAKRPLILIVNDASEETAIYKRHLKDGSNRRYRIQEAATGARALLMLKRRTPDCLLLDFRLPDIDGLEALRALANESGDLPCAVVMLVEAGETQNVVKAMKYGAHDVLEKSSITPETLAQAVDNAIENAARRNKIANDVTDRHRAECEAQLANERFTVAEAAANGYIYDRDPATNIVERSAGFGAVLGYDESESAGSHGWWQTLIHPEDIHRVREMLDRIVSGGNTDDFDGYSLEYRIRHKDGRYLWVWDRGKLMRDVEGQVTRVIGSVVNITGRKQAEDSLRESEERFRTMANTVPSIIWIAEPDGTITFHNRQWLNYCGVALGENADWMQVVIHADDLENCLAEWARAGEIGREFEAELRLRRRDGEYRWFLIRATPAFDAEGRVSKWFGVVTDIHDRKAAEEARRESDERLKLAMESAGMFVWESDLVSGRVTWSDSGEQIMGMAPGSFGGTYDAFLALVHPDDRESVISARKRALSGEAPYEAEYRKARPDGGVQWGISRGVIHYDERGLPARLVGVNVDITKRKQMEEALRLSEERFRTMANTVPSIIWMAEPGGTITFHNRQWLDYCGVAPGENADWTQLVIHADDLESCLAEWTRAGEIGREFEVELRLRRRDGEYRWFLIRATPAADAEGRVAKWFGVATDIHDRKQAEEARCESDERLKLAMEAAGMSVWETDLVSGHITWLDFGEQLMGLKPGSFGGTLDAFLALVHPDDRESVLNARKRALDGEAPYELEFRSVRDDGGVRWGLARGVVHRDEQGQPARIVGVNVDITGRKRMEEALRVSEERYRLLVRASSNVVIITDETGGNPDSGSGWWEQLTGQTWDESRNLGWMKCVHPDDYDATAATWRKALAEQESFESEFCVRARGGDYRWLSATGAPIRDAKGEFREWAVALRDITERKQTEEKLREKEKFIQSLVDAVPAGIYIYDVKERRNVFINPRLASHLGRLPDELEALGSDFLPHLLHPDEWERASAHFEALRNAPDGSVLELECRMKHNSGEWRWFICHELIFKRDADGWPRQILGVAQEITERKLSEDALQRANRRYHMSLAAIDGFIYDYSVRDNASERSEGLAKLLGSNTDEAPPEFEWWLDQIHKDDRAYFLSEVAKMLSEDSTETNYSTEYRIRHKDGRYLDVLDRALVIRDAEGLPSQIVGVVINITERKRVEAALLENAEHLRLAMEAANAGSFDWDIASGVIIWTPNYAGASSNFAGRAGTRSIKQDYQSWRASVHPEDLDWVEADIAKALAERRDLYVEYRVIVSGGGVRWVSNIGHPFYNEAGQPVRMQGLRIDVTDRRRTQERLRESEERLRLTLQGAQAGVWEVKFNPFRAYWSKEYRELYGFYETDEATSELWATRIHPDDLQRVVDANNRLLSSDQSEMRQEYRIIHPAHGERWLLDFVRVLRDPDGRPISFGGINLDVTARVRAEETLRESEERFRELVETISDVFWITDPKSGAPLYVSPAYERLWGRPAAELYSRFERRIDAIHPEDRDRVKKKYHANALEGSYDETYRVVRPDGSMAWVHDRGFPVCDDAGAVRHIVGVAEDITDRKRFEDALRESQRRYAALAEAVPQLVWTADPDGGMDYFNQRWYSYTGVTLDKSLDQEWRSLIHPDDREHVERALKREFLAGEQIHIELRLRGADGDYRWFIGRGVPYRDERRAASSSAPPRKPSSRNGSADGGNGANGGNGAMSNDEKGRIVKWFGTFTDIHNLKMAEAGVRESEERLRLAAQAAGFGLYSVDLQSGRNYWSPELKNIFGLSDDDVVVLDKSLGLIHPDDREEVMRMVETALDPRGNGEFEHEFRVSLPDGNARWALAKGKILFTGRGRRRKAARIIGVAFDITGRKEAEEKLHASEELFRTIFDLSGIGILQVDPSTGLFLRANREFCDWLGYSEAELLEMKLEDIAHPNDREEKWATVGKFLSGEMDEHSIETRCVRKDVVVVWGLITSRMLRDAAGRPLRTVTAVQDITERKQFEEALMASEARYRNLIERANEGIWLMDTEANTTYMNARMASMLGYDGVEIEGRNAYEFCFEQDMPKAVEAVNGSLQGHNQEFDFRFRRRDGSELLVLVSSCPIFDAHGAVIGAMGMFTDITERKLAEEALRESERRLKLSVTAGRAGTWEWRIKEEKMIWSDEYYDLYGLKPGEMEPTLENFLFCVHIDDRDRMLLEMSEVLQERKDAEHEFRFIRPDGSVRWAHSSAQLTLDEFGEPEMMIGIMIDITERKQAEMEREELLRKEQEARAQAEAANRSKDEFVAMVSHELRSPLNAMLGWSKILKKGGVDAKTQSHAVEVIERSARAQQNLIEDLLDMARIVGGKLRLETRPVNLARVVEAAADVVRPAAEAREIELRVSIKSADEITGDMDRLQQVIWNLLSNAVKFTTHGGSVEVILERVGPSAQITVTDTGRGIKAEDLPFIFDRFHQADSSSTRRFTGLGLGLALVKHLVELHGGQVSAESIGEGQGASFIVRLPVRAVRGEAAPIRVSGRDSLRSEDRDGRVADREAWGAYSAFPLEGIWALIVDDEADARELVATLLRQYGARVSVASCAAEAFDKLRKGEAGARPDVLVSDISMPDEDGYMLIERVRKLPTEEGGKVPAIALTAFERPNDRIKALASGFSMHVPKPVEPEELAMVIANLTGDPGKRANLR